MMTANSGKGWPPRGRAWRRWRADVQHDRRLIQIRRRRWNSFNSSFYWRRGYYAIYDRRLSITETESLTVYSYDDFEMYMNWLTRCARDNSKSCRCQMCRNPRRSSYNKRWDRMTQQERIAEEIEANAFA